MATISTTLASEKERLIKQGFRDMGFATPDQDPGLPSSKVFYLATELGTYEKFGNVVVESGDTVLLIYDTSLEGIYDPVWGKISVGVPKNGGGGSTVELITYYTDGTRVATLTIDGDRKDIFVPKSSGSGLIGEEFFEATPATRGVSLKSKYEYLNVNKGLYFSGYGTGADFEVQVVNIDSVPTRVLHSRLPIYSDSFVSAGGLSPTGGSAGITDLGMWKLLTNNPNLTSYDQNTKIATAHIPDVFQPKFNFTISGTSGAVYDLSIIDSNAANGASAYSTLSNGLYLAGTRVKNSTSLDTLLGVSAISYGLSSDNNDVTRIEWVADAGGLGVGAWHIKGNLYADGWISAGGLSPGGGGGGGIDPLAMWQILTNNPSLAQYDNYTKISADHINFPVTSVVGLTGGITAQQIAQALNLGSFAYKNSLSASDIPDLSGTYLPLAGGTMSNTNLVTNLNADLLDGLDESRFFRKSLINASADCNTMEDNSFTILDRDAGALTCSNKPSDASIAGGYGVLTVKHGSYRNQLFFPYAEYGDVFTRSSSYDDGTSAPTWRGWNKLYHSGNLTKSVLTGLLDASGGYYLPLTGGTISNSSSWSPLIIDAPAMGDKGWIRYINGGISRTLGYLGFNGIDVPAFMKADESAYYNLWHQGNSNKSDVRWTARDYRGHYLEDSGVMGMGTASSFVGGGETGAMVYVYGNNPFKIWTNGYARVTVNGGGNVGIGTTSPSYKLDVVGNARIRPTNEYGVLIGNIGNSIDAIDDVGGWANLHLNYSSTGNTSLCYGGGNVGIGTDSPAYKLDVRGDGYFSGDIKAETTKGLYYWYNNSWVNALWFYHTGDIYLGYGTATAGKSTHIDGYSTHFRTGTGLGYEVLNLYSNGEVKIGAAVTGYGHCLNIGQLSAWFYNAYYGDGSASAGPAAGSLKTGTIGLCTASNNYGLYAWCNYSTGQSNMQSGRADGTSTVMYSLCLNPMGGNVGVNTFTPSYTFDVAGVIHASTGIFSDGYVTAGAASDRRLKDDVQNLPLEFARNLLMSIHPVSFTWNSLATSLFDQYRGKDVGLIAQEIEPYMPYAIKPIFRDYKRLEYHKLIPPIIRVVQDHETRIKDLEEELKRKNQRINDLENEIKQLRLN